MPRYLVTYTQCYEYEIDAEDESEALDEAERQFKDDMYEPLCRTDWDGRHIEKIEED